MLLSLSPRTILVHFLPLHHSCFLAWGHQIPVMLFHYSTTRFVLHDPKKEQRKHHCTLWKIVYMLQIPVMLHILLYLTCATESKNEQRTHHCTLWKIVQYILQAKIWPCQHLPLFAFNKVYYLNFSTSSPLIVQCILYVVACISSLHTHQYDGFASQNLPFLLQELILLPACCSIEVDWTHQSSNRFAPQISCMFLLQELMIYCIL